MKMPIDSKNNSSVGERFNVYRILGPENLIWSVATYTIVPIKGDTSHKNRGNIKDLGWDLRTAYKSQCHGLGFIIDVNEDTIVTPSSWRFPQLDDFNGYRVLPDRIFETNPNDPNSTTRLHGTTRFRLVLRDFAFPAVRVWTVQARRGLFAVRAIGGMITALAIV